MRCIFGLCLRDKPTQTKHLKIQKMKRTIQTKFYEFNQNNSGGHFDVDENVCHRVIIEAMDEKHAVALLEPMIENQSGSCSCCGDRWSTEYAYEINFDEYKEEGYSVGVYSHYPDAEQRWFKLYGEFPRIEEPTWQTKYSSKEFSGKIYFETIEQYCQFMANAYGCPYLDYRDDPVNGDVKISINSWNILS